MTVKSSLLQFGRWTVLEELRASCMKWRSSLWRIRFKFTAKTLPSSCWKKMELRTQQEAWCSVSMLQWWSLILRKCLQRCSVARNAMLRLANAMEATFKCTVISLTVTILSFHWRKRLRLSTWFMICISLGSIQPTHWQQSWMRGVSAIEERKSHKLGLARYLVKQHTLAIPIGKVHVQVIESSSLLCPRRSGINAKQ